MLSLLAAALALLAALAAFIYFDAAPIRSPLEPSRIERAGDALTEGDLYVSTDGSDENDGIREAPFYSIEGNCVLHALLLPLFFEAPSEGDYSFRLRIAAGVPLDKVGIIR